ncbi:hypothetical protein FQA39_LY09935 [Lamprigera yunnana]|nr:hypothetical protein FQA39_LY09935 [Lamprigera yunnana]
MSNDYGQLLFTKTDSVAAKSFPLQVGVNLIGSDVQNHIRIYEDNILPLHCMVLVMENKMATVTSMSNMSFIKLNKKLLRKGKAELLTPFDKIILSNVQLVYENCTLNAQDLKLFKNDYIKPNIFVTPQHRTSGHFHTRTPRRVNTKFRPELWKWDILDNVVLPSSPLAEQLKYKKGLHQVDEDKELKISTPYKVDNIKTKLQDSSVDKTPNTVKAFESSSLEKLKHIASKNGRKSISKGKQCSILENEEPPVALHASSNSDSDVENIEILLKNDGTHENIDEKLRTPDPPPFFAPFKHATSVKRLAKDTHMMCTSCNSPNDSDMIVGDTPYSSKIQNKLKSESSFKIAENQKLLKDSSKKLFKDSDDIQATLSLSLNIMNPKPKLTRRSLKHLKFNTSFNIKGEQDSANESFSSGTSERMQKKKKLLRDSSTPISDQFVKTFEPAETPIYDNEDIKRDTKSLSKIRKNFEDGSLYEDAMNNSTVTSDSFVYESPSNYQRAVLDPNLSGIAILEKTKIEDSICESDKSGVPNNYWSPICCSNEDVSSDETEIYSTSKSKRKSGRLNKLQSASVRVSPDFIENMSCHEEGREEYNVGEKIALKLPTIQVNGIPVFKTKLEGVKSSSTSKVQRSSRPSMITRDTNKRHSCSVLTDKNVRERNEDVRVKKNSLSQNENYNLLETSKEIVPKEESLQRKQERKLDTPLNSSFKHRSVSTSKLHKVVKTPVSRSSLLSTRAGRRRSTLFKTPKEAETIEDISSVPTINNETFSEEESIQSKQENKLNTPLNSSFKPISVSTSKLHKVVKTPVSRSSLLSTRAGRQSSTLFKTPKGAETIEDISSVPTTNNETFSEEESLQSKQENKLDTPLNSSFKRISVSTSKLHKVVKTPVSRSPLLSTRAGRRSSTLFKTPKGAGTVEDISSVPTTNNETYSEEEPLSSVVETNLKSPLNNSAHHRSVLTSKLQKSSSDINSTYEGVIATKKFQTRMSSPIANIKAHDSDLPKLCKERTNNEDILNPPTNFNATFSDEESFSNVKETNLKTPSNILFRHKTAFSSEQRDGDEINANEAIVVTKHSMSKTSQLCTKTQSSNVNKMSNQVMDSDSLNTYTVLATPRDEFIWQEFNDTEEYNLQTPLSSPLKLQNVSATNVTDTINKNVMVSNTSTCKKSALGGIPSHVLIKTYNQVSDGKMSNIFATPQEKVTVEEPTNVQVTNIKTRSNNSLKRTRTSNLKVQKDETPTSSINEGAMKTEVLNAQTGTCNSGFNMTPDRVFPGNVEKTNLETPLNTSLKRKRVSSTQKMKSHCTRTTTPLSNLINTPKRTKTNVDPNDINECTPDVIDNECNTSTNNSLKYTQVSTLTSQKKLKVLKSPLNNDLTGVRSVKRLLRSKKPQTEPYNDLRDVKGVKSMFRTPKLPKSPKNDLLDVQGVKHLLKTPKEQKCPKNDLTEIKGVKSLLRTPKRQREPLNVLENVTGVKELFEGLKVQNEPNNDLRNVTGVKALFALTKEQNPLNDLTDVRGVKNLLRTPKPQKEPCNDLRDIKGVKSMFKTPKLSKSPKNDLTDVRGLRSLLNTVKKQRSPKNDLTNLEGVENLLKTPTVQKVTVDDLRDVEEIEKLFSPELAKSHLTNFIDPREDNSLMTTPKAKNNTVLIPSSDSIKEERSSRRKQNSLAALNKKAKKLRNPKSFETDYTSVYGVKQMFAIAEANARNTFNTSGVADLFQDEFDKLIGKEPLRQYPGKHSPNEKKNNLDISQISNLHVEEWVKEQNQSLLNSSKEDYRSSTPIVKGSKRKLGSGFISPDIVGDNSTKREELEKVEAVDEDKDITVDENQSVKLKKPRGRPPKTRSKEDSVNESPFKILRQLRKRNITQISNKAVTNSEDATEKIILAPTSESKQIVEKQNKAKIGKQLKSKEDSRPLTTTKLRRTIKETRKVDDHEASLSVVHMQNEENVESGNVLDSQTETEEESLPIIKTRSAKKIEQVVENFDSNNTCATRRVNQGNKPQNREDNTNHIQTKEESISITNSRSTQRGKQSKDKMQASSETEDEVITLTKPRHYTRKVKQTKVQKDIQEQSVVSPKKTRRHIIKQTELENEVGSEIEEEQKTRSTRGRTVKQDKSKHSDGEKQNETKDVEIDNTDTNSTERVAGERRNVRTRARTRGVKLNEENKEQENTERATRRTRRDQVAQHNENQDKPNGEMVELKEKTDASPEKSPMLIRSRGKNVNGTQTKTNRKVTFEKVTAIVEEEPKTARVTRKRTLKEKAEDVQTEYKKVKVGIEVCEEKKVNAKETVISSKRTRRGVPKEIDIIIEITDDELKENHEVKVPIRKSKRKR